MIYCTLGGRPFNPLGGCGGVGPVGPLRVLTLNVHKRTGNRRLRRLLRAGLFRRGGRDNTTKQVP